MLSFIIDFIRGLFKLPTLAEANFSLESSGLSDKQIRALHKCLQLLKLSRKPSLSKSDLFEVLFALGHNPSDDVIDYKLRLHKLHRLQSYSIEHLAHIWSSILSDIFDEEAILKQAFQFFDKDGNGELSIIELKTTMAEMGNLLTGDEIMEFMSIMDVNNDGAVDYQEFLDMLRSQINIVDLLEEGLIKEEDELGDQPPLLSPRGSNSSIVSFPDAIAPHPHMSESAAASFRMLHLQALSSFTLAHPHRPTAAIAERTESPPQFQSRALPAPSHASSNKGFMSGQPHVERRDHHRLEGGGAGTQEPAMALALVDLAEEGRPAVRASASCPLPSPR